MPMITAEGLADIYDCAFIGTSTISIMEAVYQRHQGKTVILIDDQPRVGGVWVSLELFGLHDVENAIHYFIYDRAGIDFMRSVLGWDVIRSVRKFRMFVPPVFGVRRIAYDNPLSLVSARMRERAATGAGSRARVFGRAVREAARRYGGSHYFARGTPDMMRRVEKLVADSDLNIMLETNVQKLEFDRAAQQVRIGTTGGEVRARRLFVTHGARLPEVSADGETIEVEKEVHRRPQIHLLVSDSSPSPVYEGIFVADDLIKYAHDVTRFTREAEQLAGRRKLFVVALRHDCQHTDDLYDRVLQRMKAAGIVAPEAVIEGTHWYESYLPELSSATLDRLQRELYPLAESLRSENFCAAIGLYGERWRSALGHPR